MFPHLLRTPLCTVRLCSTRHARLVGTPRMAGPQANRPHRDSRVIPLHVGKLLECQYAPSLSRTVQTRRFAPCRPRPKEPQCALHPPPMTVSQTGPSDRVTVRPTGSTTGATTKADGPPNRPPIANAIPVRRRATGGGKICYPPRERASSTPHRHQSSRARLRGLYGTIEWMTYIEPDSSTLGVSTRGSDSFSQLLSIMP